MNDLSPYAVAGILKSGQAEVDNLKIEGTNRQLKEAIKRLKAEARDNLALIENLAQDRDYWRDLADKRLHKHLASVAVSNGRAEIIRAIRKDPSIATSLEKREIILKREFFKTYKEYGSEELAPQAYENYFSD